MNQSNENHLRETEEILRDYPHTRDDDTMLAVLIWWKFHYSQWKNLCESNDVFAIYHALQKLPKIDSIKRYRRTLKDKYPPSKEVEEKRKKEEEESKHFYAANGQGSFLPPSFNMQHD